MAAQLCGEMAAGHPFEYSLFLTSLLAICYTFIVASVYLWCTERLPMTRLYKWLGQAIMGIHRSFTRNTQVQ
jgi:hypothetical protein